MRGSSRSNPASLTLAALGGVQLRVQLAALLRRLLARVRELVAHGGGGAGGLAVLLDEPAQLGVHPLQWYLDVRAWRWLGELMRMDDGRLARQAAWIFLPSARSRGGQRTNWRVRVRKLMTRVAEVAPSPAPRRPTR